MLFLAGHETSAAALAWALYLIAHRPDVQARMRAEADAALGDRAPEFSDLRRLPFVRDVFQETLRLYPPAPGHEPEPVSRLTVRSATGIKLEVRRREPRG
jgi:cytochrome P450